MKSYFFAKIFRRENPKIIRLDKSKFCRENSKKISDLTRVCRQLPIASGCALRSFSAFESFLQDPRFFLQDVTPVFVLGPQLFPDVLEPDVGPNEMENHSILLE